MFVASLGLQVRLDLYNAPTPSSTLLLVCSPSHMWHFPILPCSLEPVIMAKGGVPALAPSPVSLLLVLAFVTTALYNSLFSLAICTVTNEWHLKDKNPPQGTIVAALTHFLLCSPTDTISTVITCHSTPKQCMLIAAVPYQRGM